MLLLLFLLPFSFAAPWQDPTLPVAARVDNLISLLSLEEKASLLTVNSPAIPRLSFPAYAWGRECQRGLRTVAAATPFPSGVGQGSSFNESLVFAIASATAVQARAAFNIDTRAGVPSGIDCYGPTINVIRDGRWGRVNEMLGGECPFLSGFLGAAFVRGLQSLRAPSPAPGESYLGIHAVVKHLAVYSGPEGDLDDRSNVMPGMVDARYNSTTRIDERMWREYYLPGWRAAAVLGGASGFMASYQALALSNTTPATAARLAAAGAPDGAPIPDSANPLLLTDEVRGAWRMPGYVCSDAGSVICTATCRQSKNGGMRGHAFAANASDAAVRSLTAGLDLEVSCCGLPFTFETLPASVRSGVLPEALLDGALRRTLAYRFRGATLDGGRAADPWAALGEADLSPPASIALAREAAFAGVVLLKNLGFLPLSESALRGKTVAVVGPTADDGLAMMGSCEFPPSPPPFLCFAVQASRYRPSILNSSRSHLRTTNRWQCEHSPAHFYAFQGAPRRSSRSNSFSACGPEMPKRDCLRWLLAGHSGSGEQCAADSVQRGRERCHQWLSLRCRGGL